MDQRRKYRTMTQIVTNMMITHCSFVELVTLVKTQELIAIDDRIVVEAAGDASTSSNGIGLPLNRKRGKIHRYFVKQE